MMLVYYSRRFIQHIAINLIQNIFVRVKKKNERNSVKQSKKRNKSKKAKRKNPNFSRKRIDVKRIIDFEIRNKNASQI